MARPYAMLRGAMAANDDTQVDIGRLLLMTPAAVSQRMNNHTPWKLDEMYKLMERYHLPHSELNRYFPMDGKNE